MDNHETLQSIEAVIEKNVRPQLQAHGGDVEVISYDEDGVCRIRLLGHCSGCPSAFITAEEIIRAEVIRELPQVKDVVLVQETSQELLDFARSLMKGGRHV